MKVMITGASGYVGNKLAHTLAGKGVRVHALVRSHAAEELLRHPEIKVMHGDILNKESLLAAMKGCNQVYHTAAKVGAWAKDPASYYTVNVAGTENVLDAMIASGVEKAVFTSTCGVIGPTDNTPRTENDQHTAGFRIDYDHSKKISEDLILRYAAERINAVIVSPSKIYGPGNSSHSLTTNAIIDKFLKKGIAFIPSPGTYKVCFAYLSDIVNGHILAMQKGKQGEKYILGGINISYHDFFHRILTLSGKKGYILPLPKSIIKAWAFMQECTYALTGRHIRFPVRAVDHLYNNYVFSSDKAISELGYSITSLEEGLTETIHFLNNRHGM